MYSTVLCKKGKHPNIVHGTVLYEKDKCKYLVYSTVLCKKSKYPNIVYGTVLYEKDMCPNLVYSTVLCKKGKYLNMCMVQFCMRRGSVQTDV